MINEILNEEIKKAQMHMRFADSLINKTKKSELKWRVLIESVLNNLPNNLIENEFFKISYDKSYYTKTQQGTIYLIYEWFESGRDGIVSEGFGLYVQYLSENRVYKIDCSESILYRLRNLIEYAEFPNEQQIENSKIQKFIEDFLSN